MVRVHLGACNSARLRTVGTSALCKWCASLGGPRVGRRADQTGAEGVRRASAARGRRPASTDRLAHALAQRSCLTPSITGGVNPSPASVKHGSLHPLATSLARVLQVCSKTIRMSESDIPPRAKVRVLRGRPPESPTSEHDKPDRYYTTTKINALVPIAPGWAVYALFEHPPGQLEAIGPPVVRRYDVAAWGDVVESHVAVYGQEERPAGSHQYWEPLIAHGSLFAFDGCQLSNAGALANESDHFVTMSLVGPNDPRPPWVGDSAEAAAAREAIIAEVHQLFDACRKTE